MGFLGRSREAGRWADLFAGLFGGAILAAGVAALAWFYFIWPMMHALSGVGDSPPSRGSSHHNSADPAPARSDEDLETENGYDMPANWVCAYEPTMNNDWHDDVLCTDGVSSDRPYLLPHDSFVTDTELMREAARYEDHLNS